VNIVGARAWLLQLPRCVPKTSMVQLHVVSAVGSERAHKQASERQDRMRNTQQMTCAAAHTDGRRFESPLTYRCLCYVSLCGKQFDQLNVQHRSNSRTVIYIYIYIYIYIPSRDIATHSIFSIGNRVLNDSCALTPEVMRKEDA